MSAHGPAAPAGRRRRAARLVTPLLAVAVAVAVAVVAAALVAGGR